MGIGEKIDDTLVQSAPPSIKRAECGTGKLD